MQKSKTKQAVEAKMLQRIQEEPQSYTRLFSSPTSRYAEPVLALRLLKLQGFQADAEQLRQKEVQQAKGAHVGRDTEMKWASFDAAVWLATCMRELDSQMELADEVARHPWNQKLGLRVFKYVPPLLRAVDHALALPTRGVHGAPHAC